MGRIGNKKKLRGLKKSLVLHVSLSFSKKRTVKNREKAISETQLWAAGFMKRHSVMRKVSMEMVDIIVSNRVNLFS